MDVLDKVSGIAKKGTEVVAVILFAFITCVVLLQVFFRYVLNNALPWPEELVRFMLIWGAHLSFNILVIEELNINVAFLQEKFSHRMRLGINVLMILLQIGFTVMVIWYGFTYAKVGMISRSPAMSLPMIIPYLAVPVGGFFAMLQSLVQFRIYIRSFIAGEGR